MLAPKYLTLYQLTDIDVLNREPYLSLRDREVYSPPDSFEAITRGLSDLSGGVYEQIFPEEGGYEIHQLAQFLLAVGHADLPPEKEEEYNDWYNTEHIPSYSEIPGFLSARRFRIAEGSMSAMPGAPMPEARYSAMYDLVNDRVFATDEFKQRSATPWSTRIRSFTWSRRKMSNLYRLIYSKEP